MLPESSEPRGRATGKSKEDADTEVGDRLHLIHHRNVERKRSRMQTRDIVLIGTQSGTNRTMSVGLTDELILTVEA